jgi:hypothetical protein
MPGRQLLLRLNAKSMTARINQKETKQASTMLWTTSGDLTGFCFQPSPCDGSNFNCVCNKLLTDEPRMIQGYTSLKDEPSGPLHHAPRPANVDSA